MLHRPLLSSRLVAQGRQVVMVENLMSRHRPNTMPPPRRAASDEPQTAASGHVYEATACREHD
jgi:hypothetical protein